VAAGSASLLARLQADQAAARRAQDKDRVLLLGMVISEVLNREIALKRNVTDDDTVDVVRKAIKKRRESVTLYAQAGRDELAARERAEADALESYLPAQVDPDEVRVAVRQAIVAGAGSIGAVMGAVMPAFKGRVDGGTLTAIVREELARG
jgi:uncharacterized protein YqeY